MRGRKPKPTVLKKLLGNPGRRPLNEQEPKPPVGAPERPRWLSPEAKRYWNLLVAKLVKVGILADVDIGILANHCTALEDLAKARRALKKKGHVVDTPFGPKKNPWVTIGEKARDQVVKSAAELGLSASSRSRIKVEPPKPEDPFKEFQNKGQKLRVVK